MDQVVHQEVQPVVYSGPVVLFLRFFLLNWVHFQFWSYFISISSQQNPGKWSYPFIRCLIRTVLQTSGDQSATHAINNSESDSGGLHKVRTKGVLTKTAESLKGNWRSFVQYASDNFAANHASKMHRFHPSFSLANYNATYTPHLDAHDRNE